MRILTEDNFLLYAAQYYDNPQCVSTEEFRADLKRIFYIKKLCTKYKEGKGNYTRLLLNHIIVLNNLFGPLATTRMLYLKASAHFDVIKPLLIYIGIMQDTITNININNFKVYSTDIVMDEEIVNNLRELSR